jgi:hypothetical protein
MRARRRRFSKLIIMASSISCRHTSNTFGTPPRSVFS